MSRSILTTSLYIALRFSPALAAYVVLDLSQLAASDRALLVDRTLRLIATLCVWSLTEGVCMLWVREKNAGSANSKGYGIVTIIGAFLVLGMLQLFRVTCDQISFLVLLAGLALRGMTRGAWEQGRPQLALFTSMAAHTVMASLSFLLGLALLPWPTTVIAASFGTLLGAVEASWHGATFKGISFRWLLPTRRLSCVFGPLAVTTLALLGFLPPIYLVMFALAAINAQLARGVSTERFTAGSELRLSAGMYVTFVLIMLACRMSL